MQKLADIAQAPLTPEYYGIVVVLALLYYLCFASQLYGILDPLVLLLSNLVLSGAMVIWAALHGLMDPAFGWGYVACSVALVAGHWLGSHRLHFGTAGPAHADRGGGSTENLLDLNHLFVLVLVLLAIGLVSLAYGAATDALAIMKDNPANDRVSVSTANRWLVALWSGLATPGMVASVVVALESRYWERRVIGALGALCWFLVYAASGSKSGVFVLVFVLGLAAIYLRRIGSQREGVIRAAALISAVTGVAYAAFVTTKLGLNGDSWVSVLGMRMFLSGESYLYFLIDRQYDSLVFTYNPLSYLGHTFVAPFGLKLIPYNIGVALFGGYFGDYSGIGPNPQHVVEGMVFFGLYGAPAYSLVIGYLVGLSRRLPLQRVNNAYLLAYSVLFWNASQLPIDVTLWQFYVLASAGMLVPLYYTTLMVSRKLYGTPGDLVGALPTAT
ncbi:MAG TPA: hypothetical protein VGN26_18515 [Armatimonadota bacterium]|jgi:hypothetical protein